MWKVSAWDLAGESLPSFSAMEQSSSSRNTGRREGWCIIIHAGCHLARTEESERKVRTRNFAPTATLSLITAREVQQATQPQGRPAELNVFLQSNLTTLLLCSNSKGRHFLRGHYVTHWHSLFCTCTRIIPHYLLPIGLRASLKIRKISILFVKMIF